MRIFISLDYLLARTKPTEDSSCKATFYFHFWGDEMISAFKLPHALESNDLFLCCEPSRNLNRLRIYNFIVFSSQGLTFIIHRLRTLKKMIIIKKKTLWNEKRRFPHKNITGLCYGKSKEEWNCIFCCWRYAVFCILHFSLKISGKCLIIWCVTVL